jgi:hypothetical protein
MGTDPNRDLGNLIYEMPSDRFLSVQTGVRLISFAAAISAILLGALALVGGAATGNALFTTFGLAIAAGFLGLGYAVRRWIVQQDSLKVFENALVPLNRPRGAPTGTILMLNEIVSIEGNARGGAEPSSYVFTIVDKCGRRYHVHSGTLWRYDPSRAHQQLVYSELERMRRAVLRRERPQ